MQNQYLQNILDGVAVVFFTIHIILYLDEKLFQWLKSPYSKWYHKLITVQLVYDTTCLVLALYGLAVKNTSIIQRIIELIFFFKIYKLIKFDIKCMYIVIGTWFYSFYKIFRTLLIMFMAISYVGSLFYGVAYYLYTIPIQNTFLLWIVTTGAIDDCVSQPFLIQLQYAMYWALGTASTAAYGDISAAQPVLVLINILALAFQGFLFGFYLNSMHSIPIQNKQKQADLLHKFDAFQQHCSNRRIDEKLYLQILCSLQYTSSQKKSMDSIQKLLPRKYLQQIKSSIYNSFICDPVIFGNQQLQLQIAEKVVENVSQMGQDIYNYRIVNKDDLLFVKEGKIRNCLVGQFDLENITQNIVSKGYYIGLYQFITGLLIPQNAFCINYCFLYKIAREDYKKLLPQYMKIQFNNLQLMAFKYEGDNLQRQPLIKFIKNLQINNSGYVFFNFQKRKQVVNKILKVQMKRTKYERYSIPGQRHKIYIHKQRKSKDVQTQTENLRKNYIQCVYNWNQNRNQNQNKDKKSNVNIEGDQIQLKQISYL